MRSTLIRGAITLLALAALWLLLLGWAAGIAPGQPWSSPQPLQLRGADAHTVFGVATAGDDGLQVRAFGARAMGLQSWRGLAIDADDYDVLRYRFKHFSRNLSVDLIFRRAQYPDNVVTVSLPWPGANGGAIDLTRVPQWQGTITELGFSEYANTQLVPARMPFQPFTLLRADLEHRSWANLWQVLLVDWFSYRSWRQSSINSLGSDGTVRALSMVPTIAAAALGSWLLIWWLGRMPGRRALLLAVAIGWFALDAHWLVVLSGRHAQTRAMFAGKSWSQRLQLQADRDLVAGAAQVKRVLASEPAAQHVLVWAPTQFKRGRLSYHLRPLNVAQLPVGTPLDTISDGSILLVDDAARRWQFDPATGVLTSPKSSARAQPLWHDNDLSLYRLAPQQVPP